MLLGVNGQVLHATATHLPVFTNPSPRTGLDTPTTAPSTQITSIAQIEVLGIRSTKEGRVIQFRTHSNDSPVMNAVVSSTLKLAKVYAEGFKVYDDCRLIAEVEFSFKGDRLHASVNTFYFFTPDSDSTRNTVAGWGRTVNLVGEAVEVSGVEKKMIYVETIALNGNALQGTDCLLCAVEIDDIEAAKYYTAGKPIFFSGALSSMLSPPDRKVFCARSKARRCTSFLFTCQSSLAHRLSWSSRDCQLHHASQHMSTVHINRS